MKELSVLFSEIYEVLAVPFTIYNRENHVISFLPKDIPDLSIIHRHVSTIFKTKPDSVSRNPDFYVSECGAYFGYLHVRSISCQIVFGPVLDLPVSDTMLRDFIREFGLSPDSRKSLLSTLEQIPLMLRNRFLSYLLFVHYLCNHELLESSLHFSSMDQLNLRLLQNEFSRISVTAREEQTFHNSYQFEQAFLSCIEEGAVERLKDVLSNISPAVRTGIVATTSLRNAQNLFIASTTMVTRAAIRGGMNIEDAYQLSDLYIRESEQSLRSEDVHLLSVTAMMDFAQRVRQTRIPKDMSPEIYQALQFITGNVNHSLYVADVAEHVGLSRSTLNRRFQKELGFDVSSFIMRAKLEEAKSLLIHSDLSLSEISSYLCFSSQSYFQNVFKKKFGLTPMEYRRKGPHT